MKAITVAISHLLLAVLLCSSLPVASQQTDSLKKAILYSSPSHQLRERKNYLTPKSILIPVAFIDFGISSLKNEELQEFNKKIAEEVTEDAHGFKTNLDDYTRYAPIATVYLLDAAGIKARHKILDRTVVFTFSTILAGQIVTAVKHSTHQLRPDGSTYNSFPSGHTTTAFIGAEIMNQEFGWRSPWYSVAGYTMATGTALLRVMNNRHWVGDVIAGAGIGIITTKFSYWLYSKWENRKQGKQVILY